MSRVPRLPLLTLAAFVLTLSACGADGRARPEVAASPRAHDTHDAQPGQREQTGRVRAVGIAGGAGIGAAASQGPERPEADAGHGPAPAPDDAGEPPADRRPDAVAGRETVWRITDRGPEDAAVGACQKTDLETIGAISAVRRSFASGPDGAWATQVVAEFADPKSAWRAHEVLRAWQADCEERLDFARTEVGPLRTVDVRAGTGEGYRTAYGPRSAARGWATGLGIVRRGSHLSVVEYRTAATDYPTDRDPARMAVRRIARTFA